MLLLSFRPWDTVQAIPALYLWVYDILDTSGQSQTVMMPLLSLQIGAPCLLHENLLIIEVNLLKVNRLWKGVIDGHSLHPLVFL